MAELPISQSDLDESLRNSFVEVEISTPLAMRMTEQGGFEVVFYQQIGKSTTPLQTKLLFLPEAAAQLIGGLHNAIQSGAITVEITGTTSGLQ